MSVSYIPDRAESPDPQTCGTCVRGDLSNGSLFNRLPTELIVLITGDELRCIDRT